MFNQIHQSLTNTYSYGITPSLTTTESLTKTQSQSLKIDISYSYLNITIKAETITLINIPKLIHSNITSNSLTLSQTLTYIFDLLYQNIQNKFENSLSQSPKTYADAQNKEIYIITYDQQIIFHFQIGIVYVIIAITIVIVIRIYFTFRNNCIYKANRGGNMFVDAEEPFVDDFKEQKFDPLL